MRFDSAPSHQLPIHQKGHKALNKNVSSHIVHTRPLKNPIGGFLGKKRYRPTHVATISAALTVRPRIPPSPEMHSIIAV